MELYGYRKSAGLCALIMLWVIGCAPPFPKQMLEKVDAGISFQELRKDPEKYKGKWVMVAGMIVDAKNTKEGTFIEALQKPHDSQGQPIQTDDTEGRFIAVSEQFLDTAVYYKGREITVVAEVLGKKILPLGEVEYQYPLLGIKALHMWAPYSGPRFHFGIGVFHQI